MNAKPARRSLAKPRSGAHLIRLVTLLVVGVIALRSFVVTPFTIPSESMLPTLERGDYLIASKWPYGWSRWSLPFDMPLWDGTIAPRLPQRGEVAVFRHPVTRTDYVKRVIGLPGDRVALRGGQVILNGTPVPRTRIADATLAPSAEEGCNWRSAEARGDDGMLTCRYARFVETLGDRSRYAVLDMGPSVQDSYGPAIVPADHVFVLGDNRDNSLDSRFSARAGGGVGMVPTSLLVARVERVLFSMTNWPEWLTGLTGSRRNAGV